MSASRKPKRLISARFLLIGVTVYLGVVACLWAFQDQLVFPAPGPETGDWSFCETTPWVDEVHFASEDGTPLVGWWCRASDARDTVLLLHGNAENIAKQTQELVCLCQQLDLNVFAFDYRGYGKSGGEPTEEGLLRDGRAAMRELNRLTGTEPNDIVILGRSLGGGVGIRVATDLGAKALVLHATYAAIDDVAAARYWFVPVRWLIRTRMRSIDWIAGYRGPLFIAHGTNDRQIPIENGERLFEACPSQQKHFLSQQGVGHNDCITREFYTAMTEFLAQLENQAAH